MITQVNTYLSNHYEGMKPEHLILLLFKGALDRIELARQGIRENDLQKRGENLGKVIAIISELNTSVNTEMQDEGTQFLRGLYGAILIELPKVSITNDSSILDRAEKYITKLKGIWETDVMPGQGQETGSSTQVKPPALAPTKKNGIPAPMPKASMPQAAAYGSQGGVKRFNSIAV